MNCCETNLDQLLQRVADRDEAAFAALYRQTAPKLLAIARRILRQRGLAEDVLQEVYVKIWRDAGRFDPGRGSAMAWMSIMARNLSIDALRKRQRTPQPVAEMPDNSRVEFVWQPSAGIDAVDRVALMRGLSKLDDERRDMLLCAYYEGLTREELAVRFSRPVGTVKTWLRASLATLRESLSDQEVVHGE